MTPRESAINTVARAREQFQNAIICHYECDREFDIYTYSRAILWIGVKQMATGEQSIFDCTLGREKRALADFGKFVKTHARGCWIGWNMRDSKFGFEAIAHRQKTLGVNPTDKPANVLDLARTFWEIHGDDYAPHPRLQSLIALNEIAAPDFVPPQGNLVAREALAVALGQKLDAIEKLLCLQASGCLRISGAAATTTDGPIPPNSFLWAGGRHELPPIPWRLLHNLWNTPGQAGEIETVAQAVWGDAPSAAALKNAVRSVNGLLLQAGHPRSIRTKNGLLILD
ncbi:MAG TPA: hypothetical protein VFC78_21260 [Tepidisphaeraceae bacterium]|nr:hypothetical protein [Tepidisphaeraceae bacterium]